MSAIVDYINQTPWLQTVLGTLGGFTFSSVFVLVLWIGFCVIVGFTKTKRTAGGGAVVKSLDEAVSRQAVRYLAPNDPHGPVDQLGKMGY
jgi:hypothetical protein